jgi:hypothetical protein
MHACDASTGNKKQQIKYRSGKFISPVAYTTTVKLKETKEILLARMAMVVGNLRVSEQEKGLVFF